METGYKEEGLYNEGGQTLAQAALRGSGCPSPGNIQGQFGWSQFGLRNLI